MADTAFQKQYRQEMIAVFEQHQSLLRDTVTTEVVIKGNQAEFLVAGSGGEATTRGVNGLIPAGITDSTQYTATLVEWHRLVEKTGFNIFASQGNQRELMQRDAMAVINRKIDADIITELNTGTVNTGTASPASEDLAIRALTILQNADVPWDNSVFAVVTPAFNGYLLKVKSYASADYVDLKPVTANASAWSDRPKVRQWLGVNWIVHPNLPGKGTNAEKCFMFHKSAIGHAVNSGGLMSPVGYDEKQDVSWARCSVYMGSQILQNSGIVVMNHDGSAFVPA